MSLFSKIGSALSGVVKGVVNVGKNILGGVVQQATGVSISPSAQPGYGPQPMALPPMRTLPSMTLPTTMPGGAPLSTQFGQMLAQAAGIARPGVARMKRGRLTGNMIPAGFQERMSKQGVVYLAKAGRRRGISGRDLSTWRRVERVVSRIQRAHPARRRK